MKKFIREKGTYRDWIPQKEDVVFCVSDGGKRLGEQLGMISRTFKLIAPTKAISGLKILECCNVENVISTVKR
jgi:hypothetical protein